VHALSCGVGGVSEVSAMRKIGQLQGQRTCRPYTTMHLFPIRRPGFLSSRGPFVFVLRPVQMARRLGRCRSKDASLRHPQRDRSERSEAVTPVSHVVTRVRASALIASSIYRSTLTING